MRRAAERPDCFRTAFAVCRDLILESTATLRPALKPAARKRNHAHFAAEKLSQRHAYLERLALVVIEPESDLPLVGFRGAWPSEKPE
jgi:hypothetical protein